MHNTLAEGYRPYALSVKVIEGLGTPAFHDDLKGQYYEQKKLLFEIKAFNVQCKL